ncbi:hypothetical protein HYPP_04058 [Hyphomicrobium sp. ghe19]|nr:hypothetical protein HYPP_04058 [Hyphomicrobium sp. ghe19]
MFSKQIRQFFERWTAKLSSEHYKIRKTEEKSAAARR